MEQDTKILERTISSPILIYYWDKFSEQYDQKFPKVKDPQALINGINNFCEKIATEEQKPDSIMLYVIEKDNPETDPKKAKYVIIISNDSALTPGESPGYSIRLFYIPTGELESLSTFEESKVVWSPDTMKTTLHPTRTSYYMGFVYMLCEKSPGFDETPLPEFELTGAELLELGIEGELPPELITIELPPQENENETENETPYETTYEETEEDDTTVETFIHNTDDHKELNAKEEEYNDILVDYQELFD